jgi:hypothetical protein
MLTALTVTLWTADRVGQWLSANDFADKKNVFQTNGIHGAMLHELTLKDLEVHLGVKDPVERERLYRDIQTLVGRRTQYEGLMLFIQLFHDLIILLKKLQRDNDQNWKLNLKATKK